MGVKVIWHGDEVVADFDKIFKKRLNLAGAEWVRKAKAGLNRKVNRRRGSPSRKNQYPAQVTSHLKRNVVAEEAKRLFSGFGRLSKLVGTNVIYGKWLELGTSKMNKRPWMTLTNRLMRKRIIQILSAKVR